MTKLAAVACRYKLDPEKPWMSGVALMRNPSISDVQQIVDENGMPILEPWDYKLVPTLGCIIFDMAALDHS